MRPGPVEFGGEANRVPIGADRALQTFQPCLFLGIVHKCVCRFLKCREHGLTVMKRRLLVREALSECDDHKCHPRRAGIHPTRVER